MCTRRLRQLIHYYLYVHVFACNHLHCVKNITCDWWFHDEASWRHCDSDDVNDENDNDDHVNYDNADDDDDDDDEDEEDNDNDDESSLMYLICEGVKNNNRKTLV